MKRILLFVALLFAVTAVYAQTTPERYVREGYVYDKATKEPVPSVMVYIDGTSYFGITDDKGRYKIRVPHGIDSKVIFSHVSYKTFSVPIYKLSGMVYIEESINVIDPVSVTASKFDSQREKMIRAFREHFLGNDADARKCIIENEDDIQFKYDEGVLYAWIDTPLIVNNVYLGYRIHIDLKDFNLEFKNKNNINSSNAGKVYYSYYSVFEDLHEGKRIYNSRRKTLYQRTPLCFFRNVIRGTLKETNFILENKGEVINPRNYFEVTDITADLKYVEIPLKRFEEVELGTYSGYLYSILDITYNKTIKSQIIFKTSEFYVNYYGIPKEYKLIEYYGDMGNQRVAQTLPLDFEP